MRVIHTPRARAEYVDASAWYLEQGGFELVERFAAEFDRVVATIGENPKLWAEYEPGVRRALFREFPYATYYMIRSDHVFVVALMHQHRRPGYWRDRSPR